ncbi:hypothetical protein DBY63_012515 [Pseudomonas sp. RIT411]|nr:hypothetical protein DBY63_012515 [Pseudomonas sp. RIT 411]
MPLASESMHRNLAPPGRLDFSIENAYLIGVLSKTEMHDFKYLVKIRNQFAHNAMLSISFDDARIASFVGNLEFPKKVEHPYEGDNRTIFALSATMLYFALINRINDLERISVAEEIVMLAEMVS